MTFWINIRLQPILVLVLACVRTFTGVIAQHENYHSVYAQNGGDEKTCHDVTTSDVTYFINPETACAGSCPLTIYHSSSDICQIRFDFIRFKLTQPNTEGVCAEDIFLVQGATSSHLTLCGDNDDQHMYVNVDPSGGPISAIIDCSFSTFANRHWYIKITQISCSSVDKAPDDCLQYYTEASGTITSFNFQHIVPAPEVQTRQLADQNYEICIKRMPNYCSITWARDLSTKYSFTLSKQADAVPSNFLGDPSLSFTGADDCPSDYVIIPEGVDDTLHQADRFCGLGFPNSVTSEATPFVLRYRTNRIEGAEGDNGNIGFSLKYHQNAFCGIS